MGPRGVGGHSLNEARTGKFRACNISRRALSGSDTGIRRLGGHFDEVEAVADVLTAKAVRAARELGIGTLVISGGVAANSRLSGLARERCEKAGIELRVPRPRLCTDNGAMIAALGAHLVAAGVRPSSLELPTDPGLPVDTVYV